MRHIPSATSSGSVWVCAELPTDGLRAKESPRVQALRSVHTA